MCVWAADWPSTGGNPQRDGWAQGETALTKAAYNDKKVQLLYKYKVSNQASGLNALMTPIDLSTLIGYMGFKEPLYIGGSSDTVYAVDGPIGVPYFTTKLEPMEKVAATAATVACPGGMTANLAMAGISASRRFGGFSRPKGPAVFFAVSSDGYLRTLRQQDGDAKYIPPAKFLPAGARVTALNVNKDVIYASTVNGCGGSPNGLYAANYTEPTLPAMPGGALVTPPSFAVVPFLTNGSGFSGSGGTAIGATGTVYGQVAEGHGEVAGVYNDTVLAMEPKTLAVKDYFTPSGTVPVSKKGFASAGVTPVVFDWKGKDLIVEGGRDGRIYVLDSSGLGGADHHTPLSVTEPVVAPDTDFSGSGLWGTFATWVDAANGGTRWLYATVRGPATVKGAGVNGPAPTGSIVAFKLEEVEGKPTLTPQWVSSDLISPAEPVTAAGLVYALSTGLSSRVAKKDGTPYTVAEMEKMAKPAVLHVFDGATGKELFSSGTAATTFAHSGIALANGRVYFTTHDSTLFAYGVPFER
jgi:hypothetical protein